jgi:hypothetical protein
VADWFASQADTHSLENIPEVGSYGLRQWIEVCRSDDLLARIQSQADRDVRFGDLEFQRHFDDVMAAMLQELDQPSNAEEKQAAVEWVQSMGMTVTDPHRRQR